MASWVRAGTSLAEDPSPAPSTHISQLTMTSNSSSGGIYHFWPLRAPALMSQTLLICIVNNKIKYF